MHIEGNKNRLICGFYRHVSGKVWDRTRNVIYAPLDVSSGEVHICVAGAASISLNLYVVEETRVMRIGDICENKIAEKRVRAFGWKERNLN